MSAPFRTILCPIDFDELAGVAITWAAEMAEQNAAHLFVLHISPMVADFWEEGVVSRLKKLARDRFEGKLNHQFILRNGGPANEILDAAVELNADLIVIPTHGRKGLKRLILGSVAEQVIRHSRIPVLSIPASHDRSE